MCRWGPSCGPHCSSNRFISSRAWDRLTPDFNIPIAETKWPARRSEEHTSELQSRLHLVCRLLLEKNKKQHHPKQTNSRTYLFCPYTMKGSVKLRGQSPALRFYASAPRHRNYERAHTSYSMSLTHM